MNQKFRLKSSKNINHIRQAGNSFTSPLVVLITYPNNQEQLRIAVIASRSVGNAVQRNRAKRVLRAVINTKLTQIRPGYDIVLIARKPLLGSRYNKVCDIVDFLLKKAQLLN